MNSQLNTTQALFDFIAALETPTAVQLSLPKINLPLVDGRLTSSQDRFLVDFSTSSKHSYDVNTKDSSFNKIKIRHPSALITIDELFISNYTFDITKFPIEHKFIGKVSKMWSNKFSYNRLYYYKIVLPLTKKIDFNFSLQYKGSTGIKINIDNSNFHLKHYVNSTTLKSYSNFLIIECEKKLKFEEFSKNIFSILVAIGYITGNFAGDKGYFFAYTKLSNSMYSHFIFTALRESMTLSYKPVQANAYAYPSTINKKLAERLQKTLREVSTSEFCNLCQKIDSSLEFSSILLTLIESNAASLFPMAGGYAIVLEALSDFILAQFPKQDLKPIKDKMLAQLVRDEMKKLLDNLCPNLTNEERQPLIARLDNLNQKTNINSLKAPFDLLGIKLLKEDIEVIKTRNDLLHGRIPIFAIKGKDVVEKDNRILFYTALRLNILINMLIMKMIGFNNKIVNYPKIYEKFTKIKLKEDFFRTIS